MNATFASRWAEVVRAVPDRTFLVWEGRDERVTTWSYQAFDELVQFVAARLHADGVGPGSAVHLLLANSPAFVVTWLAAVRLGAWVVPADPESRSAELADQLTRCSSMVAVVGSSRTGPMTDAVVASGSSTSVVVVDEDDTELDVLKGVPRARPLAARAPWPRPLDRAAVMFTSGTTSRPKGVIVTQANYAFAGEVMAAAAALTPNDRYLVVLPMFHANAQYYCFAAAISSGASVALMPAFSATRTITQAARHHATALSLFAAPIRMILAKGLAREGSVRHCWFAQNLNHEHYQSFRELVGCRPRQLYGMTETMPAVLTDRALQPDPSAMGFPTLGCQVEIHDSRGRAVADGDVGEIVVGGRRGIEILGGYLDDPGTTERSFRDGWFLTGDRAAIGADGRWRFVGRDADILKVAGENVSAVEIEAVIGSHPDVLEVAVISAPDDIRDEVPAAFVVLASGATHLDLATLQDWAAARLAKSKRPQYWQIVDELPRTSVGKIRKFELKSLL